MAAAVLCENFRKMVMFCVAEEKDVVPSGSVPRTCVYIILTSWIDDEGNLWYPKKTNDVKRCLENSLPPSDENDKIPWIKVINDVSLISEHRIYFLISKMFYVAFLFVFL